MCLHHIFADEELYSAHFVYESIYEEIPAEVSEVKVRPGHSCTPARGL